MSFRRIKHRHTAFEKAGMVCGNTGGEAGGLFKSSDVVCKETGDISAVERPGIDKFYLRVHEVEGVDLCGYILFRVLADRKSVV
jgi:hypothetical protein